MPKLFISYSHDSPEHKDRVLALSNQLRQGGLDCRIDQYEISPPEGWPLWCGRQIDDSDFILVACTETYLRRYDKKEAPGTGRGAIWEGHSIRQDLYEAEGKNIRFIPVVFSQQDLGFVPKTLRSATIYQLPANYDDLYRHLTRQPANPMPELGAVRAMPAREPLAPQPVLGRKTIWTIPYTRNPFFTGREQILADLHQALTTRNRAALSGFGGLGKTQTALEYAYRHRSAYQATFWLKAETRDTLLSDFAAIAAALNLPEATAQQQPLAVAAAKRWLETNDGWLLILDNADDLALAREVLPKDHSGHILLTTRARALAGIAEGVPLRVMPPDDAAQLLLRRAGIAHATPADSELALQIAEELGYLPLALDQAGAFIEETPSSLAEYLNLYRARKRELLAERGSTLADHASVTVTFSLALAKVAENSPPAADLLRLCAFLAPEAIPEQIVRAGADEFEFSQVLKEATRFSLLDRDAASQTLDIHRLVQAVIQTGMSASEQASWAEQAVRSVNQAFPGIDFQNWGLCQKLLPHAQICASLIEKHNFEFSEAGRLLSQTAFYLYERALYAEAEPLYQRALVIYEKALGPNHPNVATSLNNLAELYRAQGQYAEAEPLYQRALAIREKALGPNHPDVATSLNNLAGLYHAQGLYAEAEPLYQRALAIREKALGPNHPNVATSLNNLAELYRAQGQYAEAEPLYQRALAICEKALGPNHPDVATSLNNLAALYYSQGQYAEAEPLYQRALAIYEKALGPNHPDVATSLNNLAFLYRVQGRYAEAEPLNQRDLAICEKALGPNHPDVATSLNNLAWLYRAQGQYAEAEPLYQRALAICEKALGPNHPNTATVRNNLAQNRAARLNTP